jgi:hypothetical protein
VPFTHAKRPPRQRLRSCPLSAYWACCRGLDADPIVLDHPNYVDLSESQFYRPPTYGVHVHGEIPIPSGLKTGIYTEQYAVMDEVSNQIVMQEVKFEVK